MGKLQHKPLPFIRKCRVKIKKNDDNVDELGERALR